MAAGGKDRDARAARERARAYQARQEFHEGQVRRRTRDNLIAGIVGGVLILAVVGAQVAFYTVGPGKPVPSPRTSPPPSTSTCHARRQRCSSVIARRCAWRISLPTTNTPWFFRSAHLPSPSASAAASASVSNVAHYAGPSHRVLSSALKSNMYCFLIRVIGRRCGSGARCSHRPPSCTGVGGDGV